MLFFTLSGALPIPRYSYSNRADVIIIRNVQCGGFEGSLLDCDLEFQQGENAGDYTVGVRCDGVCACDSLLAQQLVH